MHKLIFIIMVTQISNGSRYLSPMHASCPLPCHTGWEPSSTVYLTSVCLQPDIVDIKPANMEELTEVITAAQFHPISCHLLIYSSSKGTIRLCDMREKALCDEHAKCEFGGGGDGREGREGERG